MGANSQAEPPLDMSEADHCSNPKFQGLVRSSLNYITVSAQLMVKILGTPLKQILG